MSASGLPSGVTIAGATIAAGSTSATLNVSAAASAAVGNASVTITASASGVTSSTAVLTLTIQVSAENGFDPSISVPAVDITQGASQSLTINVNRANGFAGPVTFSARNVPTGLTVSFDPMVVTGTQTTLSLEADPGLAPGDYTVTIDAEADDAGSAAGGASGVAAMVTMSFTITVSIMAAGGGGTPAFSLSLSATDVTVARGGADAVILDVIRSGGFIGPVDLTISGQPAGMTVTATPASVTGDQSTIDVVVGATTPLGVHVITIDGSGTGVSDQSVDLTVTVVGPDGFTIALVSSSETIPRGGNGGTNLTVTRMGTFTGPVQLSTSGAPAGMTVTPNPASVTGTSANIDVVVGAAVPLGDHVITIDGTGTGVPAQSVEFTVTVVAAAGFTMALGSSSVTVPQGGTTDVLLTITLVGGFTGPVQLSTSGAPGGMTVTPDPASVTGTTADIDVVVGGSVTPGAYPITITGTGAGVTNQVATLTVNVTASGGGGSGNVSWTFCDQSGIPLWLGAKDGHGGSWNEVTPAGMTYNFNVSSVGGVAWVTEDDVGEFSVIQWYGDATLLQSLGSGFCQGNGLQKDIMGSVASLGAVDQATISMGGTSAVAGLQVGLNFTLQGVNDGLPQDLVAARQAFSGTSFVTDKVIIRRGLNPAPGSTLPVLDFGSGEAFDPITGNVTINNLGSDQALVTSLFATSSLAAGTLQSGLAPGGAAQTFVGIPASQTISGDLHFINASTFTAAPPFMLRNTSIYAADASTPKTITLGPHLNTATVTAPVVTPNPLLRVQYARQAEYDKLFTFGGGQSVGTGNRSFIVIMQSDYVGAGDVDFTMPDLVPAGFQSIWGLVPGSEVNYVFGASTWSGAGTAAAPIVDRRPHYGGLPRRGDHAVT